MSIGTRNLTLRNDRFEQQVWPRSLASEGALVLHAAIACAAGLTVALTGPSGIGKSTLSAGLRRHGWTLLGDDTMIVATDGGYPLAMAVFPRLRLKPDAARAICGDDADDVVLDGAGKVVFHLPEVDEPRPLDAIFVLEVSPSDRVAVERLRPSDACLAVVANSFAHDPNDSQEAAGRLDCAAGLAGHVPVFRLGYPRNFTVMPRVASAIAETLDGVVGTGEV